MRTVLSSDDCAGVLADVLLVLSELVTNAVQAGSHTIDVAWTLHCRSLRLDVGDHAAGWPEVLGSDPARNHGRGLAIVDVVADAWGAEHLGVGKSVWARLPMPEELTATVDCTQRQ